MPLGSILSISPHNSEGRTEKTMRQNILSKMASLFAVVGLLMLAAPSSSHAKALSFGLDATLGSSYTAQVGGPATDGVNPLANFGASIEVTPSLKFLMFSFDMGLLYDFVQNGMTLRPGARFHLGWFYLRAAIPLAFSFQSGTTSEPFDMGVLLGAGVKIGFGNWSFLAEANVSPMFLHIERRGVSMPAEIRLGLAYNF